MTHSLERILAVFGLAALAACGQQEQEPAATDEPVARTPESAAAPAPYTPEAKAAAAAIEADTVRAWVQELAGDEYEGRGPGSAGDDKARQYIAQQLETMGYEPAATDGTWEQPFDLVGITAEVPETWSFSSQGDTLELERWGEFIAGSGVQSDSAVIEDTEVVFVGFGIQAPEYEWDDFKGMDVSGKVLLMLNNDPDWDPDLFDGNRRLYYGRWTYKYQSAARQGAAGAIIVHTTPSAGYPWQVVQTSWTGAQFELPAGDEPRTQVTAWATEEASRRLVALAGKDLDALTEAARSRDFEPVPLGITTSLSFPNQLARVQSGNVLGLLRGSDPNLADEVVVYTAHHDHLGIGLPNLAGDPNDRIYNGARDNASGVGVVLGIAKAIAALPEPPRRSILFAFVGAEEQGLLGSEYYARNPTFPAGKIAANINYDSTNIWGRTRDLTYVGMGKSTLDEVAVSTAARQGRVVKPDQFPDRGYFYRSDQLNFARIGVPALYFRGGTEFIGREAGWGKAQINAYTQKNYHQPSDELTDDWNFEGMVEDGLIGFWAGLIIGNANEMPSWVPGDEFEAARLEALSAVR